MVFLLAGLFLAMPCARAQIAADQPASALRPPARNAVVLGIVGLRAEALRVSLVGLLRAELAAMSLSLVERPPSPDLSAWAGGAVRSDDTLLAILLDARSDQGWRAVSSRTPPASKPSLVSRSLRPALCATGSRWPRRPWKP
jgi:hypothetical protein